MLLSLINNKIVQINYDPILEAIVSSIELWTSLPISMIGRINILKMNILPKFLYLFQNIPLLPPSSLFTRIKKAFSNFIWQNKHPRLRLTYRYTYHMIDGDVNVQTFSGITWQLSCVQSCFIFLLKALLLECISNPIWLHHEYHCTYTVPVFGRPQLSKKKQKQPHCIEYDQNLV